MAKKPNYPTPTNESEAAKLLGELQKLKLALDKQQVELNQEVHKLVTAANEKAETTSDEFAEKFNVLKEYARKNKDQLTEQGKKRSVTWATGTLGWRNIPRGISVPRSAKEIALLIERIIAAKKPKFLRRKFELSVEAMESHIAEATAIEGIKVRAASEVIYIQFAVGNAIEQKIKLKTPSTTEE